MTCAVLHNMLLAEDGLADEWNHGLSQAVWADEEDSFVDPEDLPFLEYVARVEKTCLRGGTLADYEQSARDKRLSCIGPGPGKTLLLQLSDITVDTEYESSHFKLRSLLVDHYNFLYSKRMIVWPSRTGELPDHCLRH